MDLSMDEKLSGLQFLLNLCDIFFWILNAFILNSVSFIDLNF